MSLQASVRENLTIRSILPVYISTNNGFINAARLYTVSRDLLFPSLFLLLFSSATVIPNINHGIWAATLVSFWD
jgi:hypothetical protein